MKKKLITDYKKTGGGLIKRRQVLKGMSLGALTLAVGNTLSFSSAHAVASKKTSHSLTYNFLCVSTFDNGF